MRAPSRDELHRFVEDGYLVVRGAVAPDVVSACVRDIEAELRAAGTDPDDPATWTEPVVRIICPYGPAFAAAGTAPVLWATYDALIPEGRADGQPGRPCSPPARAGRGRHHPCRHAREVPVPLRGEGRHGGAGRDDHRRLRRSHRRQMARGRRAKELRQPRCVSDGRHARLPALPSRRDAAGRDGGRGPLPGALAVPRVAHGWLPDILARLPIRYQEGPTVFADSRKFAEEWTYRFLAAAPSTRPIGLRTHQRR